MEAGGGFEEPAGWGPLGLEDSRRKAGVRSQGPLRSPGALERSPQGGLGRGWEVMLSPFKKGFCTLQFINPYRPRRGSCSQHAHQVGVIPPRLRDVTQRSQGIFPWPHSTEVKHSQASWDHRPFWGPYECSKPSQKNTHMYALILKPSMCLFFFCR